MTIRSFKEFLKRNRIIYALNAHIKARRNSKRLRSLYEDYASRVRSSGLKYAESDAWKEARRRFSLRKNVANGPISRGKVHIFWVGAHYAQDRSGFLQGLELFGKVTTFTNTKGSYGLEWPTDERLSDADVVQRNGEALLGQIQSANKQEPVHILMGQMWANVLDASVLKKIQEMGIAVINVSMDDKLPDLWSSYSGRRMGSVGLVDGVDLVLTTSPDTCNWYLVEGCPAVYWPLASNPSLFSPREKKEYDVVLVGGRYGLRGDLVASIEKAGIRVDAFGPGWPNGPIGAEKVADVFNKARIILGTGNVAYNKDILTIKLRDFDAPMAGALYITHRNPDLLKLFKEGEEIECYESFDECVQKIQHYLAHPDALRKVADAGFAKARAFHSWERRFNDTFHSLGVLPQRINE